MDENQCKKPLKISGISGEKILENPAKVFSFVFGYPVITAGKSIRHM